MDWIERLIGLSPDGGDGTTEAAVVFACVVVFAVVVARRVPSLRARLGELFGAWRTR